MSDKLKNYFQPCGTMIFTERFAAASIAMLLKPVMIMVLIVLVFIPTALTATSKNSTVVSFVSPKNVQAIQ